MTKNFKCDICLKTFKTTQHLTQHKNRKKKCEPQTQSQPQLTFNPTFNSILSSTNSVNASESTQLQFSSLNSLLHSNMNTNGSELTFPGLMELIIQYKTLIDNNKKLENSIYELKNYIQKINYENAILRKKTDMVKSFIYQFQEQQMVQSDPSTVSNLTSPSVFDIASYINTEPCSDSIVY